MIPSVILLLFLSALSSDISRKEKLWHLRPMLHVASGFFAGAGLMLAAWWAWSL